MIKVFLLLVAIHGVFCAPGVPFLAYGPPAESNLAEKSLPLEKLGSDSVGAFEVLPGTRNLAEHSQLPLNLPGTRNLDEKSIPDTITLKKVPVPATELELPRYEFAGRFLSGDILEVTPKIELENQQENPQGYPQENSQGYPQENSQGYPQETPQGYQQETPQRYPQENSQGYPQETPQENSQGYPQETPQENSQGYPQETPQENSQGYPQETPQRYPQETPQGYPQETPQGYWEEYPPYPIAIPEESGSEIKGTEISPSSNTPEAVVHPAAPIPEEHNSGTDLQSTNVAPNLSPAGSSGAIDSVNIPPASSLNVQDIHGQYAHGFQNPDGTQVEESGHLISTDDGWEYVIAKKGSYQYVSPEGIPISVQYIADENGFRILGQSFGKR